MIIATVSLNQVWEDKEENLALCKEYISEASFNSVDLIIFPEMTLTGFSTNIDLIAEEKHDSETVVKFQKLAKENKIAILFGVVISEERKALNRSFFIDKDGNIIGEYSKMHPFSFSAEDKYFNAGNKLSVIDFQEHKIGLTICYDLRFPELYTALAKESDIIVNIANWPKKRVNHWNTLLKSRAIENQLFIIGVNRMGVDRNSLEYEESSMIYDTNGNLVEFNRFENMKIYVINREFTQELKKRFNTTNDKRYELYREIL